MKYFRPLDASVSNIPGDLVPVMREAFATSRMLDFASADELIKQIGAGMSDWPRVLVKELADNALDACEEAGLAPVIEIDLAGQAVTVTDNGPGITSAMVDAILDFNVRLSSREARVGPTRGAQGNALKGVVMMPFALDRSEPSRMEIEARGVLHRISVTVDQIAQQPRVTVERVASSVKTGSIIRLWWPVSASWILTGTRAAILTDVRSLIACNPHAELHLLVDGETRLRRDADNVDRTWKRWWPSQPAPAQWYNLERFGRLVGAMINHDRPGKVRLVRDFLAAELKGMTSTAKLKQVLAATGLGGKGLDALIAADGASLDQAALMGLLIALQTASPNGPKPEALGVLGPDHMRAGLMLSDDAGEFQYRKLADRIDGLPVLIEAAFAYDPGLERRRVLVGVNNATALLGPAAVPNLEYLLPDQYCDHAAPVAVFLHIAGARIGFTDRGKGRLALPQRHVNGLVEAVTAKWCAQRQREQRDERAASKREETLSAKPKRTASHKALVREHLDAAVAVTSGDGTARFSQRMLFYQMRRMLQRLSQKELQWSNFVGIITDYEAANGEIERMYRDNRGSIYIPHSKERIPIGTLSAEAFSRPSWTFNKVLAMEKEGLFEALIESGWPERNDCALLTSKGFFSRASRDLIDRLPIEGENLTIYCLHDADAAGTLIYEALSGATKARPARMVTVVNIGLDPWEGFAMGLEVERVDKVVMKSTGKEKRRPCGEYVDAQTEHPPPDDYESWADWLQDYRFELDAMTGPQQAAYLDEKLAGAFGKVIPPSEFIRVTLLKRTRKIAEETIEADVLARARPEIARRLDAVMLTAEADVPLGADLEASVADQLAEDPTLFWRSVVDDLAWGYSQERPA